MRFCPKCGGAIVSGAKFCVECGEPLVGGAAAPPSIDARPAGFRLTFAFAAVFLAILLAGVMTAYLILRLPRRELASATAPPAATSAEPGKLPPGHPSIVLPPGARKAIDQIEQQAQSKPNDIAAWNRLGDVTMRAGMFDSSFFAKSEAAYAHALKLDPDNLDALRGMGNLDYDRSRYDQAIASYEHYLHKKPDDPEVRTDLGTMYLYTGNADQAVVQYQKAIAAKPNFFEGYFNMGIAYSEQNNDQAARAAFDQALKLAPDDQARARVNEVLAKLNGTPARPSAQAPAAVAQTSAANGSFEAAIEQMVRNIPFAGPKVQSVEWPAKDRARVVMADFPMDQMPPFAKSKFIGDLKDGIQSTKAAHNIKDTIQLDIADGQSGQVMESVSQ